MKRLALLALATTAAIAAGGAAATAASAASLAAKARLEGEFHMTGQVTSALNVPGERRGNRVVRLWVFTPRCASGACSRVTLVRTTAHGRDRLQLRKRSPVRDHSPDHRRDRVRRRGGGDAAQGHL
jgi:hypothetical protein